MCSSSICVIINQTNITLGNETYFLPNTILDHLTITLDSPILHSQGNLSIESSNLHLNSKTFFDSDSALTIKNSQIYFDDESKLESLGSINLQNVTFHLSDQLIKNSKQIVLIESKTLIIASNINIIPKPSCSKLHTTSSSIVLELNTCEENMNYTTIDIIVGCIMALTFIIGIIAFFKRVRVNERNLEILMTKVKATSK
uniref:Uncharacterized protein n=1 Tax=Arcella intermedia TaxID=1963864 RepID=A0A6B2LEF6_9EUKA